MQRNETQDNPRKQFPICTGVLDYFPDALREVARVSRVGNDQHNPGEPLHWAKEKSQDEADALVRHLIQRGTQDADGCDHSAKVVWRALAMYQRELDARQATVGALAPRPIQHCYCPLCETARGLPYELQVKDWPSKCPLI